MSKKLKKAQKKQMSLKTKTILSNSFKGIISNKACLDNGTIAPWWLAILFLLVSLILPLVPNYVSLDRAYGASFVSTVNYGLDREISRATVQLKRDGDEFKIEKSLLTYNKYDEATFDDTEPIYERINPDNNQYAFRLYFTTRKGNALTKYINAKDVGLTKVCYKIGSTELYDPETDKEVGAYVPSFMVITPRTLAVGLFKSNSTKIATNTQGGLDWAHTKADDLMTKILDKTGYDITTLDIDKLPTDMVKKTFSGWKNVFNQTYLNQKEKTKWNTTLIFLGVYAALLFLMGLLTFLFTRGRANPYNTLNFWHTQKIAYFLSFTPAVIALVMGFILQGNTMGVMAFVMCCSLRTMWLSMKHLRPQQ